MRADRSIAGERGVPKGNGASHLIVESFADEN